MLNTQVANHHMHYESAFVCSSRNSPLHEGDIKPWESITVTSDVDQALEEVIMLHFGGSIIFTQDVPLLLLINSF